jgi:CxxC-x17-CxxC domain-containing protein
MSNTYQDQQLTCVECGREFTDTADDQGYRAERGYTNTPRRCPDCRAARRAGGGGGGGYSSGGYGGGGGGGYGGSRPMFDVVCASCGKETQVPFQPRGDRPVYCSDCFSRQGGGGGGGGGGGRSGYGRGGGRY